MQNCFFNNNEASTCKNFSIFPYFVDFYEILQNISLFGMEGKNQDDAPDEISAPLVFSCMHCRMIVGDSFAFLFSNEDNQTISLSAASNIKRSHDIHTSRSGDDIGSTYFTFSCCHCHTDLGRFYITTSKDIDHLREKFTFNIGCISSYELGKAQAGKLPDPIVLSIGDRIDNNTGNNQDSNDGNGCS